MLRFMVYCLVLCIVALVLAFISMCVVVMITVASGHWRGGMGDAYAGLGIGIGILLAMVSTGLWFLCITVDPFGKEQELERERLRNELRSPNFPG